MREEDHKQFFEAMEVELADHEERNHWTLMERKDLPIGTKTIMAFGHLIASIFLTVP
jgi:hypothetical protein